jgi:hypothetical protein
VAASETVTSLAPRSIAEAEWCPDGSKGPVLTDGLSYPAPARGQVVRLRGPGSNTDDMAMTVAKVAMSVSLAGPDRILIGEISMPLRCRPVNGAIKTGFSSTRTPAPPLAQRWLLSGATRAGGRWRARCR